MQVLVQYVHYSSSALFHDPFRVCDQAPLKAEAPLMLEVFYALLAGIDAAALLDAPPPSTAPGAAEERRPHRAPRAQRGDLANARAELERDQRTASALRQVCPYTLFTDLPQACHKHAVTLHILQRQAAGQGLAWGYWHGICL